MKRIAALFGLILIAIAVVAQDRPANANETRYSVVIMGNKAGFETSHLNADGSRELYYEFNDRGRGPKITERIVLNQDGIPV